MSELTIEEMNEAIAKFNAWERYEDESGIWFKREGLIMSMHPNLKDLKYDSDWSLLMPVVEKINRTMIPDNKYPASVIIFKTTCHINDDQYIIVETSSENLIQCVHEAVFLFIQWLNKQQSHN
jgi:hypothetical protein